MKIGIDVGSTTIKAVAIDEAGNIAYSSYRRHMAEINDMALQLLRDLCEVAPNASVAITGSAGMGIAERLHLPFVQEVYATQTAVRRNIENADAAIELGGEDAKIIFLSGGFEVRMNGSCAGGTGAFIDQMATLLSVSPQELNALARQHKQVYSIASRCGVFAKSDIQPLLNQGAQKPDIAASIMHAVVNQTIAGLAQGREIKGKVVYLGGPLTFFSELRQAFDETLGLNGICPDNSLYYGAIGAALSNEAAEVDIADAIAALDSAIKSDKHIAFTQTGSLFKDEAEYATFCERHAKATIPQNDSSERGEVFIGIDAGSTTVKLCAINAAEEIVFTRYLASSGNPVPIVRDFLLEFYEQHPRAKVSACAVTGYGEDIIKNAFGIDFGIVETIAHFTAAKKFDPNVTFIIDIGGQDIKCFHVRGGVIDNIFLNEACSSGCGSFLQTFAKALGYPIEDFAKLGLYAPSPVDLGSRCTVFMNSSVKQAQKDGMSMQDISAGLSISVVKNALYKVIRVSSADDLGAHIVVQGGTFLNDAVLRAFEQEIKREVTRPAISGIMGAFGAALYAKQHSIGSSSIRDKAALESFAHDVRTTNCKGCGNNCALTINSFGGGNKYIGGNKCDKPITNKDADHSQNVYQYKLELIKSYTNTDGRRGKIGIPLGLNMYELLPFWHTFFNALGFGVVTSPLSDRKLYHEGQHTIPSDTVCYPAKIMHGHIEHLINLNLSAIFYPCMTYNLDEGLGDNHYNCPVVAYYPEVIAANTNAAMRTKFICDYVGIHQQKHVAAKLHTILKKYFDGITQAEIKSALAKAYAEYEAFMSRVRVKGDEIVKAATAEGKTIIVLAGRPYHIDPEINHGIDKLLTSYGAAVVSEDTLSVFEQKQPLSVLNQWTYHARLYAAARHIAKQDNMQLLQLVSFGCGVDAITVDEVRDILEHEDKIYTLVKIDEISNQGAVKIRIRSLLEAIKH